MRKRSLRTLLVAAVAATGLVVMSVPASAQAGDAQVRVAHLSPDAPNVDVYVDGEVALSDVPYQTVSDYLSLPAGSYALEVRPAGAAADSDPVIQADATVEAGQAYTVAAVGLLADIAAQVYVDDLAAPPEGQAKVRVIHAAPDVPAVDVGVAGQAPDQALVTDLSFPDASDYLAVPADTYDLEVRPTGTSDVAVPVSGLTLEAGTVYTAIAVGSGADVTVLPVVDAAGTAGAAPEGGVQTGAGGTAPSDSSFPAAAVLTAAGLLLLTASGGLVLARRSTR